MSLRNKISKRCTESVRFESLSGSFLRVRSSGGGSVLGRQPENAQGTVIDGPVTKEGRDWLKVKFDNGVEGWVVDDFVDNETTSSNNQSTSNSNSNSNSNSKIKTFTRNLKQGDKGEDVRKLQKFLNQKGYTIAVSGSGAPGFETTYFGPATKKALIRYQNANKNSILTPNGLATGSGFFGPSTISHIEANNTLDFDTSPNQSAILNQIAELLKQIVVLQNMIKEREGR